MPPLPLESLRPAPPVPAPGAPLAAWVWLAIVLALLVAAGVVLASRH
jgi:hypothetical protein